MGASINILCYKKCADKYMRVKIYAFFILLIIFLGLFIYQECFLVSPGCTLNSNCPINSVCSGGKCTPMNNCAIFKPIDQINGDAWGVVGEFTPAFIRNPSGGIVPGYVYNGEFFDTATNKRWPGMEVFYISAPASCTVKNLNVVGSSVCYSHGLLAATPCPAGFQPL